MVDALRTRLARARCQRLIEGWLDALDADGRWALLKLLTGGLRVGVSARLAKQAAARHGPASTVAEVEEVWHALDAALRGPVRLAGGPRRAAHRRSAPGRFRPVMLAQAIDEAVDFARLDPADYAAEWKWDGIRVQAVSEGGVKRLYSRTGEDISGAFPDVIEALDFEGVIDGELLVLRDGARRALRRPAAAAEPQDRRRQADGRPSRRHPRLRPAARRRGRTCATCPSPSAAQRLEAFVGAVALAAHRPVAAAAVRRAGTALAALRADPPHGDPRGAEGLMLKRWDSIYEAGRPKGPWFKWKRDPHLIDAVLMYAQRGHGKRSSFYSDYTFGVWREDEAARLTPVGKAYFGFTDEELKQLDKFVRDNTIERFGPVRSVRADRDFGLVLEVAFEGLQRSTRHKSGVAMRFPRISRIRWDKPAREADELSTLERMLAAIEAGRAP